jgi:hypothetical protein
MTATMRYRIWFRSMRFVAFNWAVPLVFGIFIGSLANLGFAHQLALSIVEACKP